MTRRLRLMVCLIVAALPAWPAQRYQATGLVLATDPAHRTVTVSEDNIPGYMDAMVMEYRVPDPRWLAQLAPGVKIEFTLVVGKTSSHIRDVHVRSYESVERDPALVRRLNILDQAISGKTPAAVPIGKGQPVPDFTLTDQNNRPVSLAQFAGKVVAITFIYTRCPLPDYCYRMTTNFGALQRRFRDRMGRDLILLSITFDPVNDGPDVLAKYAESWRPDPDGWRFLTGPMASIKQVCAMFGMNFWPDEGLLTHSLHTVVVDRQGNLVANIEGNQFTSRQLGDLLAVTLR
jgi:protein SCO1/2